MRILVVGAGALGGYFGARLLAAGRDVTFLVRPGTAELLERNGLRVRSVVGGDLDLPTPPLVRVGEAVGLYDLILLGPKAQDLGSAIAACEGAVGSESAVLPLLNGMAHMAVLDRTFGAQHVLGGACLISATRDREGTIHNLHPADRLLFGERVPHTVTNLDAIEVALTGAGFDAQRRDHIEQDMWEKWMFIASLAGITGLMRATVGEVLAAGAQGFVLGVIEECSAVAEVEGFAPSSQFVAQARTLLMQEGSTLKASLLRDLEAGEPIERQQIVGDLLERGLAHGLALPLLSVVDANLRCYEGQQERTR